MTRKGYKKATILIADDDPALLELTAVLLSRTGCEIITAKDGNMALKAFEESQNPIHLVISDALMPGLKGPQFLEAVRALSPSTATLLLSGNAPPSDIGTRWLMKPYRPEVLAAMVEELLGACDFPQIKKEQSARGRKPSAALDPKKKVPDPNSQDVLGIIAASQPSQTE